MPAERPAFRFMGVLDVVVAASLLLIIVASTCAPIIAGQSALNKWLDTHSLIIDVVGAGECALLLLWMALGGQRSNLWNWLPPFCFFPKVLWIRWLIVIALTAGTIAGIVATP